MGNILEKTKTTNNLEKISGRMILQVDVLSESQKMLVQKMILFVKNGHNSKFKYRLSFNIIKEIQRELWLLFKISYEEHDFLNDLHILGRTGFLFIDHKDYIQDIVWLENLHIDKSNKIVRYNFCKRLSKLYLTQDGKKFVLQLLDFMSFENKQTKRLFRFMSGCKNNIITKHKSVDMIRYFDIREIKTSDELLNKVIMPAIFEINSKAKYSFQDVFAKKVVDCNTNTEYIQIGFLPIMYKYLSKSYKLTLLK